jgi:hypothetical protein
VAQKQRESECNNEMRRQRDKLFVKLRTVSINSNCEQLGLRARPDQLVSKTHRRSFVSPQTKGERAREMMCALQLVQIV